MSIKNPTQLVEEFKKSGEFDRLRRELLKEFRQSEGMAAFLARVEDIAKQKLASDPKLQYMPEANVTREIMQELERFPLVERAIAEAAMLDKDPAFQQGMHQSVRKILREDREASGQTIIDGPASTNGTSQTMGQGVIDVPWNANGVGSSITIGARRPVANADSDSEGSEQSMDIEEYSSD